MGHCPTSLLWSLGREVGVRHLGRFRKLHTVCLSHFPMLGVPSNHMGIHYPHGTQKPPTSWGSPRSSFRWNPKLENAPREVRDRTIVRLPTPPTLTRHSLVTKGTLSLVWGTLGNSTRLEEPLVSLPGSLKTDKSISWSFWTLLHLKTVFAM